MLPDYQLLEAVKRNDMEQAREAISRGANLDARDFSGGTPLSFALSHGHIPMAESLVHQGADLTLAMGKRRQTLLHWAAEQGAFGAVSFLLSHRVDVNAQQADGSTPLLLAAKNGHHYVAKLLLQNHALLSPRNASQATARSAASRAKHHDIVRLIDAAAESRPEWLQVAERQFESRSGQQTLF